MTWAYLPCACFPSAPAALDWTEDSRELSLRLERSVQWRSKPSESLRTPPGSHRRLLNPIFVAWLMGWYWLIEMICSGYWATASCPSKPSTHTESCEVD